MDKYNVLYHVEGYLKNESEAKQVLWHETKCYNTGEVKCSGFEDYYGLLWAKDGSISFSVEEDSPLSAYDKVSEKVLDMVINKKGVDTGKFVPMAARLKSVEGGGKCYSADEIYMMYKEREAKKEPLKSVYEVVFSLDASIWNENDKEKIGRVKLDGFVKEGGSSFLRAKNATISLTIEAKDPYEAYEIGHDSLTKKVKKEDVGKLKVVGARPLSVRQGEKTWNEHDIYKMYRERELLESKEEPEMDDR